MSSFFSKLKQGLGRSRDSLSRILPGSGAAQLSEDAWLDIEDALIMADCGPELAAWLVARARASRDMPMNTLRQAMLAQIPETPMIKQPQQGPLVLLIAGVNGTGKTTTIGKLATMFRQEGKRVLVGAADTFRAAAVEQLAVWVERAGAEIVRQHAGADPASVAFDTVKRGVARNFDVVIVDTAGRVQTDKGLMNELGKVRRVMGKAWDGAPHEVWHVVDGGTGQNAVVQVEQFREVVHTTGLIVTKLDGAAKGGIVLQLLRTFGLPVRYVGVGENLEDLLPFDGKAFVDGLLPEMDVS